MSTKQSKQLNVLKYFDRSSKILLASACLILAAIAAEIFGGVETKFLLLSLSAEAVLFVCLILSKVIQSILSSRDWPVSINRQFSPSEESEEIEVDMDLYNNGQFKSLIKLIEMLQTNIPFKDILKSIYNNFFEYLPYTHIGVSLIDNDSQTIRASYAVSSKIHGSLKNKLIGFQIPVNETSLGKILKSGKPRVINDLEQYLQGREIKDYNRMLLDSGIKSSITFPLINNGIPIGIIFFSSNKTNVYNQEHINFLRTLANSLMLSLEKDILMDDMIISSTLAMATLTEERDLDTGEHLYRMKRYSRFLADLLLSEKVYPEIIDADFISSIERFSPLHDIGKVAIRDSILLKPGKLTQKEFEIMKTHTTYGANVLKMADENLIKLGRSVFKMGIEIAEGHHEKWDGNGYPYGKKGSEIPLSARIVAVADVFDALTSKRSYKPAYSFEESVSIIAGEKGKQFDPVIIDVFLKDIDKFEHYYKSVLSRQLHQQASGAAQEPGPAERV
ncbi:MAG TPA: HD domain-containing phosphohydrolase [Clostridia bacterium]|nr:HD domain-containing phosphohydrolase [Clostridia bacterium]